MNQFEIAWQAPEFEYRAKTPNWYWTTVIVAAAVLGIAVWQRNFLFTVFIVAAEVLILVWSSKQPEMVEFHLSEKGLMIHGRTLYPVADFESFSIEDDPAGPWHTIAFRFHRRFRPLLHVKVPQSRFQEIDERLSVVVQKTAWDESFIDTLEKFFGF
jgi:hypothetical protein